MSKAVNTCWCVLLKQSNALLAIIVKRVVVPAVLQVSALVLVRAPKCPCISLQRRFHGGKDKFEQYQVIVRLWDP